MVPLCGFRRTGTPLSNGEQVQLLRDGPQRGRVQTALTAKRDFLTPAFAATAAGAGTRESPNQRSRLENDPDGHVSTARHTPRAGRRLRPRPGPRGTRSRRSRNSQDQASGHGGALV